MGVHAVFPERLRILTRIRTRIDPEGRILDLGIAETDENQLDVFGKSGMAFRLGDRVGAAAETAHGGEEFRMGENGPFGLQSAA